MVIIYLRPKSWLVKSVIKSSIWKTLCHNPSLGLATKAKACKGAGQEECERVWGWRLTLPSELPLWELESRWTLEPLESDRSGQNTSHWRILYIIGKLLKCRCLKWARMTHSNIFNTSYGKKKGRESNWQFDSRPWNVGNRPNFRACRWCMTHRWKALDKLQLCFRPHLDRRSEHEVIAPRSCKSSSLSNFGTPLQESRDKKPFGCSPRGEVQNILYGGRWWLPPSPGCGESCESKVTDGLS